MSHKILERRGKVLSVEPSAGEGSDVEKPHDKEEGSCADSKRHPKVDNHEYAQRKLNNLSRSHIEAPRRHVEEKQTKGHRKEVGEKENPN